MQNLLISLTLPSTSCLDSNSHRPSPTPLSPFSIRVSISGDRLSTAVYYNPIDSHSIWTTPPPKDTISQFQFLCLHCICFQDKAFYSRTSEMSSFLINMVSSFTRASSVLEFRARYPSPQIEYLWSLPFILPASASDTLFSNISSTHDPIISLPISTVYHRDQSLRNSLVHSSLPKPLLLQVLSSETTSDVTPIPTHPPSHPFRDPSQVRLRFTSTSSNLIH